MSGAEPGRCRLCQRTRGPPWRRPAMADAMRGRSRAGCGSNGDGCGGTDRRAAFPL